MIFIARKARIICIPDSRKKDKVPTPLLGGCALFLSIGIVLYAYRPLSDQMFSILIGATIIFLLGAIDDIWKLSSLVRLAGQLLASGIVMANGIIISFMPDTIVGNIGAVVITLVWILGIVNATNFADGLDGLATGIALIAGIFFFLIPLHLGQYQVCLLAAVLIGSCGGFLIFNFKPAKIYLGDGGSTLVGFLLACLALYGGWSDRGPFVALGIPVLILGVLIYDMIYITVSRIRRGTVKNFRQWLDHRGQDHLHHRLMNLSFSERYAVLFIYLLSIILGMSALAIENSRTSYHVVATLIQAFLIFIVITILMLTGRKLTRNA